MKFYTLEEVADIFQVHLETVRRWVRSGELEASQIKKRLWRVSEGDLMKFYEERKNKKSVS